MKVEILDSQVHFVERRLQKPLQLSSGTIHEVTETQVEVGVRLDGRVARGFGSIYLSDLWAWPEPGRSHEEKDLTLRRVCDTINLHLREFCGEPSHPLQMGLCLHDQVCSKDAWSSIPVLALAMCASPFDAAIHDAVGQALNRSAFQLFEEEQSIPLADAYFKGGDTVAAIRELLTSPRASLPAWLIVGKNDNLLEDMGPWIKDRGYHCFKLKTTGKDAGEDARRTAEVYQAAVDLGAESPRLSVDSNEGNPNAESVLDYLEQLEILSPEAYAALEYLEQPTGRDIEDHAFDWRAITERKPVFLDEGLTRLDLLPLAKEQGWSGLAIKTCKGHSFLLVAAAWARREGMDLALQDLTNPGHAAVHAALVAAHVPTLNGVELNSPQFTPAANEAWLPQLRELFEVRDGQHRLPPQVPPGLGSIWKNATDLDR